jgi:muramoyltetrapeptide carboxypeptidase LdcA involved in peptidoglycan recycling
MRTFVPLAKCAVGDQVAVLSPSAGLPGLFPWVQDLGLDRMRTVFGLVPREYPTTRVMGASLVDRARDVMAAFADPANAAVFASIGGDDQIKLIRYLDPDVFRANPKPFFGFSDNTHLHNFLWNLGIPSFYGGSIMNQFAMPGGMPAVTVESLRRALFDGGGYELVEAREYNDVDLDWAEPANLGLSRVFEPSEGFQWDGSGVAEGVLWGGCVESLVFQSAVGKYLPGDEDLDGAVLFVETSERVPEPWLLQYLLSGFGERGWLARFRAVLVGRPKAWTLEKPNPGAWKVAYRAAQRAEVLAVVREYNAEIPVVQNLDFGHTSPQVIVPNGGRARIDADARRISFSY